MKTLKLSLVALSMIYMGCAVAVGDDAAKKAEAEKKVKQEARRKDIEALNKGSTRKLTGSVDAEGQTWQKGRVIELAANDADVHNVKLSWTDKIKKFSGATLNTITTHKKLCAALAAGAVVIGAGIAWHRNKAKKEDPELNIQTKHIDDINVHVVLE